MNLFRLVLLRIKIVLILGVVVTVVVLLELVEAVLIIVGHMNFVWGQKNWWTSNIQLFWFKRLEKLVISQMNNLGSWLLYLFRNRLFWLCLIAWDYWFDIDVELFVVPPIILNQVLVHFHSHWIPNTVHFSHTVRSLIIKMKVVGIIHYLIEVSWFKVVVISLYVLAS